LPACLPPTVRSTRRVTNIAFIPRPIYGTQFHPEKAIYEWFMPGNIPHSRNAIALAQHLANFFVSKARCSAHRFSGGFAEESSLLIQATARMHKVNTSDYFMERYVF
jgi:hypothetical protein